MASDFDKDALEVERNYSHNWFTKRTARWFLKHNWPLGYRFAEWLVGWANVIRSASPRDGYEWVDRRKSLFSKYGAEQQRELIAGSLDEVSHE